jgi:ribose 1,5-bisphosphokinase
MPEARLYYVIGASGSGKDSILSWARTRLADRSDIVFAHRYITRPAEAGGENHVALSEAEFDARLTAGLFAMHWASHGWRYAVGTEIDLWLARGCRVVMNGSREYLPTALKRYPRLRAVLVQVAPAVLAERLRRRGRERPDAVTQRCARAAQFDVRHPRLSTVDNNGALDEAGRRLVALLDAH